MGFFISVSDHCWTIILFIYLFIYLFIFLSFVFLVVVVVIVAISWAAPAAYGSPQARG